MREAERAGAVITDPARDRIDHAHGIVSGFGRTATAERRPVRGRRGCMGTPAFYASYSTAVLLTNASIVLSGDHEGTLIVPCPP